MFKSSMRAALALGTLLLLLAAAAPAKASGQEGTVYAFGDSLLDLRYVCPVEYHGGFGACGNGRGLLQYLPRYAPFTFDIQNDHAAGGAGTGAYNVASVILPQVALGTLTQIENFKAAGGRIQPQDLTLVSGRNDFYQLAADPSLNGAALARQSLANVSAEVGTLVSVGAGNIVFFDSRSPSAPSTPQDNALQDIFSAGLPATLAPYARPGVRIRLFNLTQLTADVQADPALYGFATGKSCADDDGCEAAPIGFQDEHFLYDQHPTEAGFSLIARYIANLDGADDALAAQANVAAGATNDFTGILLDRASLDGETGSARGLFIDGGYSQANQGSWSGSAGSALGYSGGEASTVVGFSQIVAPATTAAIAFGYGHANVDLDQGDGNIRLDSFEGGAYADWRPGAFFLDASLGAARHDLNIRRPGVVDNIDGAPSGWSVSPNLRAGWLRQVAPVAIGPVAQFGYDHTHIDGYVETGDPVLTQGVRGTDANLFNAQAGIRLEPASALPFKIRGFLQATASHDFTGGNRVLQSYETYAPGLPIYTVVGPGWDNRTYASFEGAFSVAITQRAQAFIQGTATAFRSGGNDCSGQLGLKIPL